MTGRPHKPTPSGAFGEADQEPRRTPIQSERAPKGTYVAEEDDWGGGPDVLALTVPPDERPSNAGLPGTIEEAVLQMLEQVPASTRPSPELPPGTVSPPRKTVRPR